MPNAKTRMVPPFSADGKAKPQYYVGIGNLGATVLRKASEIASRSCWARSTTCARRFGSTEKLLATYGTRRVGLHRSTHLGNPVPTTVGAASYNAHPLPFTFIAQGPTVIYSPINSKDFATIQYATDQAELAAGVPDPTNGLYSASNSKLGPSLRQSSGGRHQRVVTGRQPMSDWPAIVGDVAEERRQHDPGGVPGRARRLVNRIDPTRKRTRLSVILRTRRNEVEHLLPHPMPRTAAHGCAVPQNQSTRG